MTDDDAKVQEASILKYLSEKKGLIDTYLAKHGKVVNTDEARKLFADVGYIGTNAAAVQEAASAVGKDAFRKLLKNPEPDAVLYAGGSGSGKTSAVSKLLPDVEKNAAAVLDGNLSTLKTAENRINELRAAGKKPRIVYVYSSKITKVPTK